MWRSFDVGAVVELLEFDAVVVAGADGMSRQVRRSRTVTDTNDLGRVDAGDLVVLAGTSLGSSVEGRNRLAEVLVDADAAGLVVDADVADQLASDLLRTADRLTLPVISFPQDMSLADVTVAVLDALLAAQERRLERFLDIHQHFTPVVLAGGDVKRIAATLHALVGYPVAVLDAAGEAIVTAPPDADIDVATAAASGTRQPIRAGDEVYGDLILLSGDRPLDDDQLVALERASTAIAVRLAQSRAAAADHERFAAISLEELIAGHAGDAADIRERALSFGWDLTLPRAVLLASIDPPHDPLTLRPALATIAASARATVGRDAIVWTRSTTIAALIAPANDEPAERRQIAEALRRDLDDRRLGPTISIGVGRCVDDPTELARSYVEASRAVDVGRWAKGRHVTEIFDELGLERLLASTPAEHLDDFVRQTVGALIDHDRLHETGLVETLGVWLETRNMAEAARVLHIHYNTFKHRLHRIETILGPIVDDAARALECQIALYVVRHYDGPWTPTEPV